VEHYEWVTGKGSREDYSFASEAAMRLGSLYESEKKYTLAKKYYKLSTDLYKNRYYEYIGSKAEKGLTRVSARMKK
jgi:hypothetical protein